MTRNQQALDPEPDTDKTQPPLTGLRFALPAQLYKDMPTLPQMT